MIKDILNKISAPCKSNNYHSELVSESNHTTSNFLIRGRKREGFTLAETLITLVIIGVIAAITIPTIMTAHQQEQVVTKLKKTYSTLAQAIEKSSSENGTPDTWEPATGTTLAAARTFYDDYLSKYLITQKVIYGELANYNMVNMRGTPYANTTRMVRVFLNDGVLVNIEIALSRIDNQNYYSPRFFIDINGLHKPNRIGRDVFVFGLRTFEENSFLSPPSYTETRDVLKTNPSNGCNRNYSGFYCSTLIMKDGWRIADDYPW